MCRLALMLLAACGPAFAPVTVRFINDAPGKVVLVNNRAEVKLHPECTANCELRGGLLDGGFGWTSIPQQRVDAGVAIESEPRLVELDATVKTTVFVAQDVISSSFAEHDGGFEGVPGRGQIIIVENLADGGVAFGLLLP